MDYTIFQLSKPLDIAVCVSYCTIILNKTSRALQARFHIHAYKIDEDMD